MIPLWLALIGVGCFIFGWILKGVSQKKNNYYVYPKYLPPTVERKSLNQAIEWYDKVRKN